MLGYTTTILDDDDPMKKDLLDFEDKIKEEMLAKYTGTYHRIQELGGAGFENSEE